MNYSLNFPNFLFDELCKAYLEARKGKRKTNDEHRFELNAYENILLLRNDILNRNYKPSRGVCFIIHDPVIREIFAAPFRDRVVHHFLYNICYDWWDKRLIEDSYSCRVNKGTLYGEYRLAHHIRSATNNFKTPAFAIKADLQGYFMSLDRERLVERINWGLGRQFKNNYNELYKTVKYLWREIIMDDPIKDVKIRGKWSDWDALPPSKSLFYQPEGKGIVIGNLTSQILSNIYLDQLDRYITLSLGYKHYGRYVDDFYIVVPETQKSQLLNDMELIKNYISSLGLTLHPNKLYKQSTKYGVPFTGAVVHEGYILPGKRVKGKCRKAFYSFMNDKNNIESVQSYLGHLEHINSRKFLKQLFDELGWDFKE